MTVPKAVSDPNKNNDLDYRPARIEPLSFNNLPRACKPRGLAWTTAVELFAFLSELDSAPLAFACSDLFQRELGVKGPITSAAHARRILCDLAGAYAALLEADAADFLAWPPR